MTTAETFMKYDYAEMKDLLKTFITLVSSTLVLSLTFSDKIIKYETALRKQKQLLIISWSLMLFALTMAGISLVLIACAAGKIIYGSIPFLDWDHWSLAWLSVAFGLVAGSGYVISLTALMMAVIRTPHAPSHPKSDT
jgi:hypothetical protein